MEQSKQFRKCCKKFLILLISVNETTLRKLSQMKITRILYHLEDLDAESKYLAHKAKEATNHAYAPYSKFCVGAALIFDDGTIISGSNQEKCSLPALYVC